MLQFKDFAPRKTEDGFFSTKWESFEDALAAANHWIDQEQIEVINIETVTLPNIWREEGTTDVEITSMGEFLDNWYQFIRVWYRG